jgi:hypothetical protein
MSSPFQLIPPSSLALLGPAIGLNLWTFVMEVWMYATRIPAIHKFNVPINPEATKEQFNAKIPANTRWKADNFNHLHEQPTQFYSIIFILVLLGADSSFDITLAWTYLGLRVIHSLVQAMTNKIMRRFRIFAASSVVLLLLSLRAGLLFVSVVGTVN